MLVNSDRFLIASNQRSYFNDQKNFYTHELQRITKLFEKAYHKKRAFKKKNKLLQKQLSQTASANMAT